MSERSGADSALLIRAATIGETEQFLEIFSAAFRLNRDAARPLFYRDPFFDLKLKRVCLVDGVIVSCLTIVPCRLRIGLGLVPMAGIAGVATRPENRNRGFAGALLEDTIRQSSSELGYPISGLFPAVPNYYAKFGWTYASNLSTWTIPREALPSTESSTLCVRPASPSHPSDIGAIAALHDSVTKERTGACYRGAMRWRVIHEMMGARETYLVENGDSVEGYANLESDPARKTLIVHEMHASTKAAASALTQFLATFTDVHTVEWIADPSDIEYFGLTGNANAAVEADAMLRINDVCGALAAVYPAEYAPHFKGGQKGLTLIVRDPVNGANEVPVTLDSRGVRRCAEGAHAVATDIGTLTRLFVGYTSAGEARASGSLYASDERSFAIAEKLFPSRQPQIASLDRF